MFLSDSSINMKAAFVCALALVLVAAATATNEDGYDMSPKHLFVRQGQGVSTLYFTHF
jgi:hypothetical protein